MKQQSTQTIKVKSNEQDREPLELIAKSIIDVANGFDAINKSRLTKRAVLLLLRDCTGVGMNDIEKILDAGPKLKAHYIKSVPK